jgi:hypothetical protein
MPFRLAKLTACRKVRGFYRRHRAKSSAYGHKSAMAQAHPGILAAQKQATIDVAAHAGARPGSSPLARINRTASDVAMKATKARAGAGSAAVAGSPAA